VAAISGVCFGGGLEIALACDIRICTHRSLFAFPEINLNLIPALGGLKRLQNLCGHRAAIEILSGGDTLNAHRAFELKIVDRVVEEKDCRQFAVDYLNSLVHDRPKKVISMLMKSFRNADMLPFEEAQKKDVDMFCELALDASLQDKNVK
jgi:enoyl-CoA hydratase/carnithine racemase